jgi:hypothetical protein
MSDLSTAALAGGKAACAASLAACFTGFDAIALIGAMAGALLVTFDQEQVRVRRLFSVAVLTIIFSMSMVWLIVDALPAVTKYLEVPHIELGLGRGGVAFLVAYLSQRYILPALGKLCTWVFTLGGRAG